MPSFDIVCEIDLQELDNAVNQTGREMRGRFDFKGSCSTLDLDKDKKLIKIEADDDMKLRSIHQILESKVARRGLDCRVLNYKDPLEASGRSLRQEVLLRCGLEKEDAKKLTKLIKESKLKVQAQIQQDQVRVTGKKIDDLQAVIAMLKGSDISFPLQFVNMRS